MWNIVLFVGKMISAWSRVTYSTRAPRKPRSLSFFLRVFSLDRSLFRARGQVFPSWTAEDFRGSLTMNLHSVLEYEERKSATEGSWLGVGLELGIWSSCHRRESSLSRLSSSAVVLRTLTGDLP